MKPFSLFLQTLSLSILIMIQATSGHNLISSICKNTSKTYPDISYNFCKTSLQAAPGSKCATIQGLGSISIRLVLYNVTDTGYHIKQLLKNKKLEPFFRRCLSECFQFYDLAIYNAKFAMRFYRAGRFHNLNTQISAIMADAHSCKDYFDEGGVVLPLMKRYNDTIQLSVVALSIMHIIQTGSS